MTAIKNPEVTIIRELLKANSGFVSGNRLAEIIRISRVGVWSHMEKLRTQGFVFEAVRSKGYRLVEKPESLHPLLIEANLVARKEPPPIIFLEEVDSTNSEAERRLANGEEAPFIVIGRSQTAGRGRLGRRWFSGDSGNLLLSIAFRPNLSPDRMRNFTLWMSVNLCEAIANTCKISPGVKWPNDLLYEGRKLGGILTEARIDSDQTRDVIFGLGLNINGHRENWPKDIASRTTSISDALGHKVDINRLTAVLINRILTAYKQFIGNDFTDSFSNMWEQFDLLRGKQISLLQGKTRFQGIASGIDDSGALRLKLNTGAELAVHAGDVTIEKK